MREHAPEPLAHGESWQAGENKELCGLVSMAIDPYYDLGSGICGIISITACSEHALARRDTTTFTLIIVTLRKALQT